MTLERTTIEGRQATVAYLDENFEPTTPEKATQVEIVFDDGEVRFAVAPDARTPVRPC